MSKKSKISRKQLMILLNRIDKLKDAEFRDKEGYSLIRYADVTMEIIKWSEGRE